MVKSGKTLKIRFFANENKEYERALVEAITRGFPPVEVISDRRLVPADLVLLMGLKNFDILAHYKALGVPVVYFDKAHDRCKYSFRVAFNSNQPTDNLIGKKRDGSRAERYGWQAKPWRGTGDNILIAGSSAKYHAVAGISYPTDYATKVIKTIKQVSNRHIIYRPKPSWKDATPIDGSEFSHNGTIRPFMDDAFVLVTYGSNACFDALRAGVPSVILGDGITRSLSSTSLADIDNPRLASEKSIQHFLNQLAWYQWLYEEFGNGDFWEFVKCELKL